MTTVYPFPVSDSEFKDKRVLVTGGTKGMGEAIVRRYIRADRRWDSRRRSEGR
jgi:NAD(P)-dependent dehydrogenase (short-subunit alcohol dehydrogenase family)